MRNQLLAGVCGLAFVVTAGTADAGMKDNTLNVGLTDSYAHIHPTLQPGGEMQVMHRNVLGTLQNFDKKTGKLAPSLALSVKRINPTTWEYKLRKDVKWHDGQPFSGEDIVYSINWSSNPKLKITAPARFRWVKRAELIDKYTIRIVTKKPFVSTARRMAVTWQMVPKHAQSAAKSPLAFGRKLVGTGPYKVISVDPGKGVVFERNKNYNLQNSVMGTPTIDKVVFRSIPDEQTMAAELITGGLDVTRIFAKDLGENLARRPNLNATPVNSFRYYFLSLDALSRSGVKALSDIRVRRAIAHAINRKEVVGEVLAGGKALIPLDSPCLPSQFGCRVTNAPAEYNVAKAKALMKEAGYENGFSMKFIGLKESGSLSEALAGYLRKINIKVSIQTMPMVAYRKTRGQGKIPGLVNIYGSGGIPDVARVFEFYWRGPKTATIIITMR